MGHSTMLIDFDGCFDVLSSAAENYDDKVGSTVCANTCRTSMHSTSYDTNNGPDMFYDVDTDVDTIMANAHNMVLAYYSNGAHVPDNTWSKLPQSSRKAWQGIPTEDCKLIMGTGNSISNLTGRKVSFLNDHSADDGTADTEPTDDTDDIDLIDDVLDQYPMSTLLHYVPMLPSERTLSL
jgi:hypothetical protein